MPTHPFPIYRQIADDLREGIYRGDYAPGDRLPTNTQLIGIYGHARATVRQALDVLKAEGLISAEQGRGTFVRHRRPIKRRIANHYRPHSGAGPWTTETRAQGFNSKLTLVGVDEDEADELVAAWLEIEVGDPVIARRYRCTIDDHPVQMDITWFPADLFTDTPLAGDAYLQDGIYAAMRPLGLIPSFFDEELRCRPITVEEADQFALNPGASIIEVLRITRCGDRVTDVRQSIIDPVSTHFCYSARIDPDEITLFGDQPPQGS